MSTEITTRIVTRPAAPTPERDETPVATVEVEVRVLTGTVASWAEVRGQRRAIITLDDGVQFSLACSGPREANQVGELVGRRVQVEVVDVDREERYARDGELKVLDADWIGDLDYAALLAKAIMWTAGCLDREVQPEPYGAPATEGYTYTSGELFGLLHAAALLTGRPHRTESEIMGRVRDARFEPEDYRVEYVAKYIRPIETRKVVGRA